MLLVSWPAKIEPQAEPRQQYLHAVDIVPTLYELVGIEPPDVLKGYRQLPIQGESFAAAFTDPEAPGRTTQFFAMLGQRSIYHDGWLACTVHPPLSGWGNYEHDEWELFHLESDRAQTTNLADREPERLELLKGLWFYNAGLYNGLPLDDRSALEQVLAERPRAAPPRDRYLFYPDCADVPESAGPQLPGRSFTIAAGIVVDRAEVAGVLWAAGGVPGGHSLYVQDGTLRYTYNWIGTVLQDVVSEVTIPLGAHVCSAEFAADGPNDDPEMPGTKGTLTLYLDGDAVASAPLVTQPGAFCLTGDGICVGRDSASAVTPAYDAPFPFTGGTIDKVVVDVYGDRYLDHEAQVRAWFSID
jgi:arylsulfatase